MKHRLLLAVVLAALAAGCSGGGSKSAPTAPSGNHPPTISVNTDKLKLKPAQTAQITVTVNDADGDQLTLGYTATGGTVASSGPTALTATFTAGSQPGPASVQATANDGQGGTASGTAGLYVQNPAPPAFQLYAVVEPGSTPVRKYLVIETPEPVTITAVDASRCFTVSTDFSGPVTLPAGGQLAIKQPGGSGWDNVGNGSGQCSICVQIHGSRPDPDGGTFAFFGCAF